MGRTFWGMIAVLSSGVVPMAAMADAQSAQRFGSALFEMDRAVTLAMREADDTRAYRKDTRVQGWVVDTTPAGFEFTFVGQDDGAIVALYRTVVEPGERKANGLEKLKSEPLTASQHAQFTARRLAEQQERMVCANESETMVLPDGNGWRAYVVPRSSFPEVVMMGGTYRISVDGASGAVSEVLPLATDCVVMQNRPGSSSLLFAEDLGLEPNELHIYTSLRAGKPLYLSTTSNGRVWLIQGDNVQQVVSIPANAG